MANYKMGVSWSVHIWQRMFKQKELELHFLTIDRMVQHWIESLPKKVQFQFEILISKKAFLIEEISEKYFKIRKIFQLKIQDLTNFVF